MPRMWMVPVDSMCDKHLIAEHHECHVFAGRIRKGMTIQQYIDGNYLEPRSIMNRHDDLADEMARRGFNHDSMMILTVDHLPAPQLLARIDSKATKAELHKRCLKCKDRYDERY